VIALEPLSCLWCSRSMQPGETVQLVPPDTARMHIASWRERVACVDCCREPGRPKWLRVKWTRRTT
jgi:ribosomal protein L24E